MKELNKFRKFLAEGEAKGFTFIFKKGKTGENQIKKAKEILKDKKISFTSGGQMALDFSASQNQKDVKKALGDNGITRYIIGDIKEDLAEDRGGFEMKELNKFREFLAEGSSKLMSQGEYWVKNNDLGPKTTTADIEKWVSDNFEKYAKPGDDKAKIIADLAAYNDGLNKFLNEGTWGYGSKNQMLKALDKLNKIKQMGGVKGSVELSKIDSMLYDVFGSDDFHDSIDQAKDNAIDDDKFVNYIGDAQAKGMKMLNDIYSDEGANAFTKAADNPDVVGRDMMAEERNTFEITPEYLFDAAIQYIQDDYDGASLHVAPDGSTDDFYDGDKHVHTIKSKEQAEDIINNFEAQMVKTAQNDLEENDTTLDEIIGEEKESLTKQIMKKYPKRYPDEKAVKVAAAKLMKDPKFKVKKGIGPVLQSLLKGK